MLLVPGGFIGLELAADVAAEDLAAALVFYSSANSSMPARNLSKLGEDDGSSQASGRDVLGVLSTASALSSSTFTGVFFYSTVAESAALRRVELLPCFAWTSASGLASGFSTSLPSR